MLLSSMDHLNYYGMPKDSYLEVDQGHMGVLPAHLQAHHHHHLQAPPPQVQVPVGGYALPGEDLASLGYLNGANEENSPKNGTKSSLYKTELCKRFSEFGNCRYGAKCQFAHGIAELRHVVRHPKYKTTKCKSYWGSGHCPYGSRCRFIHEEAEAFAQPQYSPPGAMTGSGALGGAMFKEQQFGGGMGSLMMPPSSSASSGGDLSLAGYGGLYASAPSYPKDNYSLFDKSATWGPSAARASPRGASAPQLGAFSAASVVGPPAPPQALGSSAVSANSGVNPGTATGNNAGASTFPDLQDAIDALMKFSLTSDTDEGAAGQPTTSAVVASSAAAVATATASSTALKSPTLEHAKLARATGTDFALESDELWKDFPGSTSDLSDSLREPQHWSAGLSLSLDSSPFDIGTGDKPSSSNNNAGVVETGANASGTSSGSSSSSEESPRLSVFERFH